MSKSLPWNEIKEEYETLGTNAQVLSLKYKISPSAVYTRAKAEGWQRAVIDKSTESEKEEEILAAEISDDELADITYENAHAATKRIIARLLKELDQTTAKIDEIDHLIKDETTGDRDYKRRRILRFVSSMSARTIMVKNLAVAIKTLRDLEKEEEAVKGKKNKQENAARTLDINKFAVGIPPNRLVA